MNEAKAMLRQIMKGDASPRLDSLSNSHDNFLIADGLSSSSGIDGVNLSSLVSGVTLLEVPPTSGQSTYVPATSGISGHCPSAAISEIQSSPRATTSEKITTAQFPDVSALVGAQKPPSVSVPQADIIVPELSEIPEMVPESIVDIPTENYVRSETGNGGFIDPTALVMNGSVPIELDDIASNPDIDALLENTTFWDDLLVQSPVPEDNASCFSLFPQFMSNLQRSQFVQVFNNSPAETAYFRMLLNRENIMNAAAMIQPSLISYSFNSLPQPALLDVASISAYRVFFLDSYFNIVIFHGETIVQWLNLDYNNQPEHQAFAQLLPTPQSNARITQLLPAPQPDAQMIIRERVPVTRLGIRDQHRSSSSSQAAIQVPEVPQENGYANGQPVLAISDTNGEAVSNGSTGQPPQHGVNPFEDPYWDFPPPPFEDPPQPPEPPRPDPRVPWVYIANCNNYGTHYIFQPILQTGSTWNWYGGMVLKNLVHHLHRVISLLPPLTRGRWKGLAQFDSQGISLPVKAFNFYIDRSIHGQHKSARDENDAVAWK